MDTQLHLEAVKDLCKEIPLHNMSITSNARFALELCFLGIENPPDWAIAGLNCVNDADILPVCIHTFLLDWKPPEVEK